MRWNRDQRADVRSKLTLARRLRCGILLLVAVFEMAGHAELTMTKSYQVSRYELRGNTLLPPEVASNVLTTAVGPAVPL